MIHSASRTSNLDLIFLAAHACGEFVHIRPFFDGNGGRMCRIIPNTIVLKDLGVLALMGESAGDRERYFKIVKDRSENCAGDGALAAFVTGKVVGRLKEEMRCLGE